MTNSIITPTERACEMTDDIKFFDPETGKQTMSDLHALLDGLTVGERIKATWKRDAYLTIIEGPVRIDGREVMCGGFIRWGDGSINRALTSIEVTRDEEVTITRDDRAALHALLDSLEDEEVVTAEWHNEVGSMSITGIVRTYGSLREVYGYTYCGLRERNGMLHPSLHSVTVRRPVVQRWERAGNE